MASPARRFGIRSTPSRDLGRILGAGFQDFAKRFGPFLAAYDKLNVTSPRVHPTEIAFDTHGAARRGGGEGPQAFGSTTILTSRLPGSGLRRFHRALGSRFSHAVKDVWWATATARWASSAATPVSVTRGAIGISARRVRGDIKFETSLSP